MDGISRGIISWTVPTWILRRDRKKGRKKRNNEQHKEGKREMSKRERDDEGVTNVRKKNHLRYSYVLDKNESLLFLQMISWHDNGRCNEYFQRKAKGKKRNGKQEGE